MANNEDRYKNYQDGQVAIVVPGMVDRGRRCQNCTAFDNSPKALDHYEQRRLIDIQRDAKALLEREGVDLSQAAPKRLGDLDPHMQQLGANISLGDQYVKEGVLGVCEKDAAPGDFVHAFFLCDQWDEKFKPDGSEKLDLLPHEARIEAGLDDE